MTTQVKIRLKNIHKILQGKPILQGVSFAAQKGEVVALLGKSGSGKSTLLRCINLLTMPDAGEISIDNQVLKFGSETKSQLNTQEIINLRQKVGMVFQQFNLWAHMTVLQNLIAAPMYVLKQKKAATISEGKHLLAKVGLENFCDAYPAQLSGGQQQRAAIARALMMKPEIMLFDEPTSALDPEMVGEVLSVIQGLAKEGMTIIIATHELNFAKRVANEVIFLSEGKIAEQGLTKTLFTSPKTFALQRFLDAMQY